MLNKTLIRNFALRSGKQEEEVFVFWKVTEDLAEEAGFVLHSGDRSEIAERHYMFRLGKLKQLLQIETNQQIADSLVEVGLKDVAAFFLGSGTAARMSCAARMCKNNNQKGKCTLAVSSLSLNRNWECLNYERRT